MRWVLQLRRQLLLQLSINGEPVPESLFSNEYRRLAELQRNQPESMHVSEQRLRELAEDGVISYVLLRQEARRRIATPDHKEVERRVRHVEKRSQAPLPDAARERLRADMEDQVRIVELENRLVSALGPVRVLDARTAYDENPGEFAEPERVHCSHIVRHTFGGADPSRALKQILAAQDELKRGVDFDQVVKNHSDEHGQGGDLGTFARGSMVERFEDVVFKLPPGKLSDVFETEFGYHIAIVHEHIPAKTKPFPQVQKKVIARLEQQRREKVMQELISRLRSEAEIRRPERPEPPLGEEPQDESVPPDGPS